MSQEHVNLLISCFLSFLCGIIETLIWIAFIKNIKKGGDSDEM